MTSGWHCLRIIYNCIIEFFKIIKYTFRTNNKPMDYNQLLDH